MTMTRLYEIMRPALFRVDPETAHGMALCALKTGMMPGCAQMDDAALKVTLWNRSFPNPVGLAAGFDKNAEAIGPLLRLGFGAVEIGTVTPRPQHGNPRPRIFRDPASESVINRMGFPNGGLNRFKDNLGRFLGRKPRPAGIVGLNIGMNKSQTDPAKDYCLLVQQLAPLADYLAINISSPNTPGLRDLQNPENLRPLLSRIVEERGNACKIDPPPLLLKLSPDLDAAQREAIAKAVMESGVDGLILTNTTLSRPDGLKGDYAAQAGGLSGRPLQDRSTAAIADFYRLTGGRLPIIGVGGIMTGRDAYEKIKAGASLVQLYTALVYRGPHVVREINRELLDCLRQDGLTHVGEAVGTAARNNDEKAQQTA